VERSGLSSLTKFVTTLHNWWEVILNYFHERLTSGFVEGMNNT
jgi:transposase